VVFNIKKSLIIFCLTGVLVGCGGKDVGTRLSSLGSGVSAQDQNISGMTLIMKPQLEDITEESFNIRYIEASFGSGTPSNVRDLAVEQCDKLDKQAFYKGTSRGLIQLHTVKAYYECV
jgi:hypothetical protein